MPGSEADAELLRQTNPDAKIIALPLLDAVSENLDLDIQNAFDAALDQAGESQVHLVGFSIGTMVAIKLAAMRPENVSQLSLISAAAPLSLGNFLPKMAGKTCVRLGYEASQIAAASDVVSGCNCTCIP